ncbi:MAG: Type prenyl endopeptidase Rce1-like [Actinomycetota bacterium]
MTALATVRRPDSAIAAVTLGCAALVARPLFLDSTAEAVALFATLLAVGTLWPADSSLRALYRASTWRVNAPALIVGLAAFALGRVIGGGHPPVPFAARFIVLNTLAAVAEEAFFRRLLYGALERHGAALAVAGSTILFALVHVTVYGWWVLPIDLAAGLVLSWQRWATGSWTVPAVTHVVANVLVVI